MGGEREWSERERVESGRIVCSERELGEIGEGVGEGKNEDISPPSLSVGLGDILFLHSLLPIILLKRGGDGVRREGESKGQ